jgi:hypothetical protein
MYEDELKEKLSKTKIQILEVLEAFPETRNCDILLLTTIWKMYHKNYLNYDMSGYSLPLSNLSKIPSGSDVVRLRAKIQNSLRKFLPTNERVAKQRKWNMEIWRELMKESDLNSTN